ncbi:hypothetical protein MP228_002182 [Amoeboaphelidium protococcarum]|nr:hypothetical protein MP228_002182 [Amoeboaphelidium protococcarum]
MISLVEEKYKDLCQIELGVQSVHAEYEESADHTMQQLSHSDRQIQHSTVGLTLGGSGVINYVNVVYSQACSLFNANFSRCEYMVPLVDIDYDINHVHFIYRQPPSDFTKLSEIKERLEDEQILTILNQLTVTLQHLHEYGLVHGNLSGDCIYWNGQNILLSNYWLYSSTNYGQWIRFPILSVDLMSPERLLSDGYALFNDDVWALGMLAYNLASGQPFFDHPSSRKNDHDGNNNDYQFLHMLRSGQFQSEYVQRKLDNIECHSVVKDLILKCLVVSIKDRISLESIQQLLLSSTSIQASKPPAISPIDPYTVDRLCMHLYRLTSSGGATSGLQNQKRMNKIYRMPKIIKTQFNSQSPIYSRRQYYQFGQEIGSSTDPYLLYDKQTFDHYLDLSRVFKSCAASDTLQHTKVLRSDDEADIDVSGVSKQILIGDSVVNLPQICIQNIDKPELPLAQRQKDCQYQLYLVQSYHKLLQFLPHSNQLLHRFCKLHDIPLFMAGQIWSALLDIQQSCADQFHQVDSTQQMEVDKQLDLDLPRCHPYHKQIASYYGRGMLRQIIKAWMLSNNGLVYWQGLDSVCAPFVVLHYFDISAAYACFDKFIQRYLYSFFRSDNSKVLKEHLHLMKVLLTWYDPQLATALDNIGFTLDLFAIPWILTLFAHILPLQKTIQLWSMIMAHGMDHSSVSVFIGLAILHNSSIRQNLLTADFTDCMQFVGASSIVGLDMEQIFSTASELYKQCPQSMYIVADQSYQSLPQYISDGEPIAYLSIQDVIKLAGEGDGVCIIDCRVELLFKQSHHRGSINIPDADLIDESSLRSATSDKVVVVVGDNAQKVQRIARLLVHDFNVMKVSILSGGWDALQSHFGHELMSESTLDPPLPPPRSD